MMKIRAIRRMTGRRDGRTGTLGVGFVLALAGAIMLPQPANAALIISHSGSASVNCGTPAPALGGADDATVTCNDGNSNDQTVDVTIDFGIDPFDQFDLGVGNTPSGNVQYLLRINNNSGEDWTDFSLSFAFGVGGGVGAGLTAFDSTDIVFDAGGGSLDSFSFDKFNLDFNFATAVTSGTGFDIGYTLAYGDTAAKSNPCGNCNTAITPSNTFQPPPPTEVPEPASLTLFGTGLALLGLALRRRRKAA